MRKVTFENGIIELDDQALPGIFKNMSVRGQVVFDEAKQDARSGTIKKPMGWQDADISMTVQLLTDNDTTCYEKLQTLDSVFKGFDTDGNPPVFSVVNSHTFARGIEKVIFSGLNSSETDQNNVMLCNLSFTEHLPPIIKVEERNPASQTEGSTPATSSPDPKLDDSIIGNIG